MLCSALTNCDYEKERPEGSIRAIVFPTEGAKPLLSYIPYGKDQKDGLHERAEEILNKHDNQDFVKMIAEALTDEEDYIKPTPTACIDDNKVRGGRDTENVLEVWTQLYYPGALPNKSISTAMGAKSKMFQPWDRAVLVFALSNPKTDPRGDMFYKDISLRDFRDAVDWIADFRNPARNRGEGPRENVRRETNWYKYNNPAAIAEDRAERRRAAQDRDSNFNDLFGGREEPWEYEGYDDRYDDRFGGVEEEEMTDRGVSKSQTFFFFIPLLRRRTFLSFVLL